MLIFNSYVSLPVSIYLQEFPLQNLRRSRIWHVFAIFFAGGLKPNPGQFWYVSIRYTYHKSWKSGYTMAYLLSMGLQEARERSIIFGHRGFAWYMVGTLNKSAPEAILT